MKSNRLCPLLAGIALALSASMSLAQQAETTPQATESTPAETRSGTPSMDLMMQQMEEMESHWEKMHQTQDPAQRQQLMQEHRQKMRELSTMMRSAHQQGMGSMGDCRRCMKQHHGGPGMQQGMGAMPRGGQDTQ